MGWFIVLLWGVGVIGGWGERENPISLSPHLPKFLFLYVSVHDTGCSQPEGNSRYDKAS